MPLLAPQVQLLLPLGGVGLVELGAQQVVLELDQKGAPCDQIALEDFELVMRPSS